MDEFIKIFFLNVGIFFLLLILPGLILQSLFNLKAKITTLPLAFLLTLSLYAPIIGLSYIFNFPLLLMFGIFAVIEIALIGYFFIKKKETITNFFKGPGPRKLLLTLAAFTIIYLFIFSLFPANFGSDSAYHFAHVRNIINQDRVINEEAIIILDDQSKINPGYKDNQWYVTWAIMGSITKTEPQDIARTINPIFIILGALSSVYLASRFKDKSRIKLVTGAFYIFVLLFFRPIDGVMAFWPNRIGTLILLPTIISLFINYLRENDPQKKIFYFITGTAGFVVSGGIHNMVMMYSFMGAGAYALLSWFFTRDKKNYLKKIIYFFGFALLLTIPFVIIKYQTVVDYSNFSSTVTSRPETVSLLGGYYYKFYFPRDIVYLTGGLITFLLLTIYITKKKVIPSWLVYTLSGVLAVLVVRQNPFLAPIFTKYFSGVYMERFTYLIPTVIIFSFAYDYLFGKSKRIHNYLVPYLIILIALGALKLPLSPTSLESYQNNQDYFKDMAGVSKYINEKLPPKTRIATEENCGFAIAGRSNVRVITVVPSHNSVYSRPYYEGRSHDLKILFEADHRKINPEKRLDILDNYSTEYILIAIQNRYIDKNSLYYDGPAIVNSFKKDKAYELVYDDGYYQLYKTIESA